MRKLQISPTEGKLRKLRSSQEIRNAKFIVQPLVRSYSLVSKWDTRSALNEIWEYTQGERDSGIKRRTFIRVY